MIQQHPVLNKYIFKKLSEIGLSKIELIKKAGYSNITKGMRRLKEFEYSGNIEGVLLNKIIGILNIDPEELNQLLFEERMIVEEDKFNRWKTNVNLPRSSLVVCNRCIFLKKLEREKHSELFAKRGVCTHPLLNDRVLYIDIAKYRGFCRPELCPLGYRKDVDEYEMDGTKV